MAPKNKFRISEEKTRAARKLYESGVGADALGQVYGCAGATMLRVLRAAGTTIRGAGNPSGMGSKRKPPKRAKKSAAETIKQVRELANLGYNPGAIQLETELGINEIEAITKKRRSPGRDALTANY